MICAFRLRGPQRITCRSSVTRDQVSDALSDDGLRGLTIRSSRPAKDAPEDDRTIIPQSERMMSIPDDDGPKEIPGR
jgi:hypothetical protein